MDKDVKLYQLENQIRQLKSANFLNKNKISDIENELNLLKKNGPTNGLGMSKL